jgi:hypothetical protein
MIIALKKLLFSLIFIFLGWLCHRILAWRIRIRRVRESMPAVPLIIPPFAIIRHFIPQQFQTYPPHWLVQDVKCRVKFDTDIVPMICLFGRDVFLVANPEAISEIVGNVTRFPKDMEQYRTSPRLMS